MTIEIKQLIIRATVEQRQSQPRPASTLRAEPPPPASAPARLGPGDHQEFMAACVRQVLRQLRKGRER